jgi:bifunctional DNA-binding transcriptional regulator/antitoxin component of YhaV-PrlF toxin-antitoxin module
MSEQVTFDIRVDKNGNIYLKKEILKLLNVNKHDLLTLQVNLKDKTGIINKKITAMDRLKKNIENNVIIRINEAENKILDKEIQQMVEN